MQTSDMAGVHSFTDDSDLEIITIMIKYKKNQKSTPTLLRDISDLEVYNLF